MLAGRAQEVAARFRIALRRFTVPAHQSLEEIKRHGNVHRNGDEGLRSNKGRTFRAEDGPGGRAFNAPNVNDW